MLLSNKKLLNSKGYEEMKQDIKKIN